MNKQIGFTLIELVIVVMIMAIIAAIVIPSYDRYVVKNAESRAQTKMLSIEMELERWRASTLTYRNFKPLLITSGGTNTYGYDSSDNKTINMPNGYTITLTNNDGNSLVSDTASISWVMLAVPSSDFQNRGAARFLLTSTGLKCKSFDRNFCTTVSSSCTCETGTESW